MRNFGFCAALLFLGAAAQAAPTDVVPRGHVAYDLLGSLAAAGLAPGLTLRDFLRGDRLYTRAEMARFVAATRAANTKSAPRRALALVALEREFAPELRDLGIAPVTSSAAPSRSDRRVQAALPFRSGSRIAHVRVAGVLPVGRDGYAALSAGSFRSEWYPGARRNYPAVESAFVHVEGRALDVTVGLMPLRWGPGYYGPLLLSDASPSVPMVAVQKGFTLPGTLGRRIGRLHFRQFAGQFFEGTCRTPRPTPGHAPLPVRTAAGNCGRRALTLSLAESFKSTRLPDPFFAFLLPFYVYQNDWTETSRDRWLEFLVSDPQPNTFWLNYLASAGLSYRADARGTTLYTDLLIDDTEAPRGLGLGNEVPRKLGVQVGVYAPDLGGVGRYAARLEFASIDATTYSNVSRPINWEHDGLPSASPAGRMCASGSGASRHACRPAPCRR